MPSAHAAVGVSRVCSWRVGWLACTWRAGVKLDSAASPSGAGWCRQSRPYTETWPSLLESNGCRSQPP